MQATTADPNIICDAIEWTANEELRDSRWEGMHAMWLRSNAFERVAMDAHVVWAPDLAVARPPAPAAYDEERLWEFSRLI